MQLLLVRHAIAEAHNRQRWPNDALRPLTARGRRRLRRAAAGVVRLNLVPDMCLTSPYRRAMQTAAMLHQYAGWPAPVKTAWLLPGRRFERLLTDVAASRAGCVALVGHQPALGRLLAWLISGDLAAANVAFRKGAIACIECAAVPARGRGELQWLLTPRVLRAAGR
jgi:phosphohistidine phosphatase